MNSSNLVRKTITLAALFLAIVASILIPALALLLIAVTAILMKTGRLSIKFGIVTITAIILSVAGAGLHYMSTLSKSATDCYTMDNIFKNTTASDVVASNLADGHGCGITLSVDNNAVSLGPLIPNDGSTPQTFDELKNLVSKLVRSNPEKYKIVADAKEIMFQDKPALRVDATTDAGNSLIYLYIEAPKTYKTANGETKYFVLKVNNEAYINKTEQNLHFTIE